MGIALLSACVTEQTQKLRHENPRMFYREPFALNQLVFHADLVTELKSAIKIELLSTEEIQTGIHDSFNYKGS